MKSQMGLRLIRRNELREINGNTLQIYSLKRRERNRWKLGHKVILLFLPLLLQNKMRAQFEGN